MTINYVMARKCSLSDLVCPFTFVFNSKFFLFSFQTHPSQTCFLSSVDLHTQYSYQVCKLHSNLKQYFQLT